MQVDLDLKTIKRKVYMSYFQDGLWDILLGIFLIDWGFMIAFDLVAAMSGLWIAFYFGILGLKRWLVYPRAGYIKITEARKQQMRMVILGVVLLLSGLAVFFLVFIDSIPAWFSEYFMFMFGTMIALVISILAFWWRVNRWYVYSGIILAAFAFHQWLETPLNLSFLVPGIIFILYGLALLIRFLHRNPKPAREEKDFVS